MSQEHEPIKLEYKHKAGDVLTYKETAQVSMPASPILELMIPQEITFEFTITEVVTQVDSDGVMEVVSVREFLPLYTETAGDAQAMIEVLQRTTHIFVSSRQMRRNGSSVLPAVADDFEPAPGLPLAAPSALTLNLPSGFPDEPLMPGAMWTRAISPPFPPCVSLDRPVTPGQYTLAGFERVEGYECALVKEELEPQTGTIGDMPVTITFIDRRLAFAVAEGMLIKTGGRVQTEVEGVSKAIEGRSVRELSSIEHLPSEELKSIKRELKLIRGGLFYLRREEHAKAKASFEKLLERFPASRWHAQVEELLVQTLVSLAKAHEKEERWDDVIATCQEAIRFEKNNADAHFLLGRAYRESGLFDEAIATLKEAIHLQPSNADAYHQLGHAYEGKGMIDDAIKEFKEAIRLKPDDVSVHVCLGISYCNQERWDDAIRQLQEAIPLDPNYAYTHFWLGRAYCGKGLLDEAIAEFKECIRLQPDDANVYHLWLGYAYQESGMIDDAIAALKKSIYLQPDNAKSHYDMGIAYCHKESFDEAICELEEAVRLEPENAVSHNQLGCVYADKEMWDEAIVAWKKAVQLEPDSAMNHENLGYAFVQKELFDEAIVECQAAIRLDSENAGSHFWLGRAYRGKGLTDNAIAEFRETIRLQSDDAHAYYHLGRAYEDKDLTDDAVTAWEESLKLNPDYTEARNALARVKDNKNETGT